MRCEVRSLDVRSAACLYEDGSAHLFTNFHAIENSGFAAADSLHALLHHVLSALSVDGNITPTRPNGRSYCFAADTDRSPSAGVKDEDTRFFSADGI